MAHQYLYPYRKRMEILSAVFAGGFGVYIWAVSIYSEPMPWARLYGTDALIFGQIMTTAAIIHALGVRINGKWRWSPVMRLFGMVIHTLLFGWLASAGFGTTAGYTYTWGCGLLLFGALSALGDTRHALKGQESWMGN